MEWNFIKKNTALFQTAMNGKKHGFKEVDPWLKEIKINHVSLCGQWEMKQEMEKILRDYING